MSRLLRLEWPGGASHALPHRLLRERCPCAQCRQARRAGKTISAEAVSVLRIEPYGPNAIHLVFSDGHGTGIYPWKLLREITQP